ncbi:winged helix-turn-helix domain-containing protein, partial [Spirillospora sp. NPDC049652]
MAIDLHISLDGSGDLTARIHRQLLDAILDGRLRPGERLPPTREFARRLNVSRNTVAVAYERLTAEGLLVARVGSGTFVGRAPVGRTRNGPEGDAVRPRPLWDAPEAPATVAAEATASAVEPLASAAEPATFAAATRASAAEPAALAAAPAAAAAERPAFSAEPAAAAPAVYDFRVGTPDAELFPLAVWRRLLAGVWRASAIRT